MDDQLAQLLTRNSELFAAYGRWSDGQVMLLAGTASDPDSFNAAGGKTGALGYYPVVNVSGQTVYVPSIARLKEIALGGANAELVATLIAGVNERISSVGVRLTLQSVDALPAAAGNAGTMIYVTDDETGSVTAFCDGSRWRRTTDRGILGPQLKALGLTAATIAENAAGGTVVGTLTGVKAGSSLSLTDNAGGRFAIDGSNRIVAGLTGTDYETARSHSITVTEAKAGTVNSPRDSSFTISVTDVYEAPVTAPTGTSIDAEGWKVTTPNPTDLSLTPIQVARPGFDATGAATSYTDSLYLTKRVRQPYPNATTLTADRQALSDYVYSGDTIASTTNSSTEASPKPTADWVMPHRLLVGGSVHWELIAFHRDARQGRQVSSVRVRATNGSTSTAWQRVAATAVSTLCDDRAAVEVYRGDLDVSALADGLIWLEAEVYPWIGGAAAVRTTAGASGAAEFGPRYFLKDVARAATPPIAYVSPGGSDSAGVWSTNAATAKATPFATVVGAQAGIYASAYAAVTGGKADGCRIRLMAGQHALTSPATTLKRRLDAAAMVIERDPDSPRASCIAALNGWTPQTGVKADGSASSLLAPLTETATLFYDISIVRTGAGQIGSTASGSVSVGHFVQFWNVVVDGGAQTGTWIPSAGSVHDAAFGLEITNGSPNLQNGTNARRRIWRGLKATSVGIEGGLVVGCEITSPGAISPTVVTTGIVAYANRLLRVERETFAPGPAPAGNIQDRFVLAQNLIEFTGASSVPRAVSVSADNSTTSLFHPIVIHNTATGIGSVGRWNILYDETNGTNRTHRLHRIAANLLPQINTKGDEFTGSRGDTDAAGHVGNFAYEHGAASEANFSVYVDAQGGGAQFSQLYPGLASKIAAGDPGFVNYQGSAGTPTTPVAGAGGGDYRLQSGSPARALLSGAVLGFDLAGAPRGGGAQAAGAYA